ncbi:hypothetical protein [Coleofasciculus sp.]|uniref:hypothetical protein n=1 Tax=Coleofasciculus sp. TaxID=3100458 RepID=UPI003A34EE6E
MNTSWIRTATITVIDVARALHRPSINSTLFPLAITGLPKSLEYRFNPYPTDTATG